MHTEYDFNTPRSEAGGHWPVDIPVPDTGAFPAYTDGDDTSSMDLDSMANQGYEIEGRIREGGAEITTPPVPKPAQGASTSSIPEPKACGEILAKAKAAYLMQTSLQSGRPALLVDVGSVGNLAGREWMRSAAAVGRMFGMRSVQTPRPKALSVSGVGSGSQQCTHDCTVPVTLQTIDGRAVVGTFTAPTVNETNTGAGSSQDGLPALLGLRALREKRAIIDFSRNGEMLIAFPGPGDVDISYSPGTDVFQMQTASTGHLMLPCAEHGAQAQSPPSEDTIALTTHQSTQGASTSSIPVKAAPLPLPLR